MTLAEAHEIQRKELIALRRENEKLRKSGHSASDIEKLEKEIRSLKYQLNSARKSESDTKELLKHARERVAMLSDFQYKYHELLKQNDSLMREILSLKQQLAQSNNTVTSQSTQLNHLTCQNNQQAEELKAAQDTIEALKIQLNKSHENSSIPSSKERFPKKIKNSREQSGRTPGGQKGHTGAKRPHMEPTCPIITIPVPEEILNNPDYYPTGKIISKQVADLHFTVSVTEYQTPEYRSRSTGKRVHAPFPDNLRNEFNYGENTKSLAFLLNNYCNVSIDKVSEIISGLSEGKICLSKGMINDLARQFSDATKEDRQRIYDSLLKAPVMYSDATPAKVNGKTMQIYVSSNPDEILYTLCEHKGYEGLNNTPVAEYHQTLVHDHDKTYYNYGLDHQECLSHVLRYLLNVMENEPDLRWSWSMHALLTDMIHTSKHSDGLSKGQISFYEDIYDEILKVAEGEYELHPPTKYFTDGFNLMKRMIEYRNNHLYFLHHPEVEYCNNRSERALRQVKRKVHQVIAFRSKENLTYFCDVLSILQTARMYETNIFNLATEAFAKV